MIDSMRGSSLGASRSHADLGRNGEREQRVAQKDSVMKSLVAMLARGCVICVALVSLPAAADIQEIEPDPAGGEFPAFAGSIALDSATGTFAGGANHYAAVGKGFPGAVELYERQTDGWVRTSVLRDPEVQWFGWRLSAGGGWIAVAGALSNFVEVIDLYRHDGGTWTFRQRLTPLIPGVAFTHIDQFDVDGDNLIVSLTYYPGTIGVTPVSQVAAYRHDGASWQPAGTLETPFSRNRIGRSLALSGDVAAVSVDQFVQSASLTQVSSFVRQNGQWVYTSSIGTPPHVSTSQSHRMTFCNGELVVASTPVSNDSNTGIVQRYSGSAQAWMPRGQPLSSGDLYFGVGLDCSGSLLGISAAQSGKAFSVDLSLGSDPGLRTIDLPAGQDLQSEIVVHAGDVLVNDLGDRDPPQYRGRVLAFLAGGDSIFSSRFE